MLTIGEIMDEKKWKDGLSLYKFSMWLASAALAMIAIVLIVWKTIDDTIVLITLLAILVLISNFFVYIGMEKPMKDERTRKIGTMAATYAWYVTLAFTCFIMIYGYYTGRSFSGPEVFGIVIFTSVISVLAFNVYFGHIGDVE